MRPHARPSAGPGRRPHVRRRTVPARRAAGTPDWAGTAAAAPPPRTAPPSAPPPRGWRDGRALGSGRTRALPSARAQRDLPPAPRAGTRSEEHTSELQSLAYLVCRLLLEKKKNNCVNERDSINFIAQELVLH